MSEEFNNGAADKLFERIEKDETGEMKHLVMDLVDTCKRLSQLGVPLDELATCCTLAWYMGQSPEFEALFEMMLKAATLKENIDN